MIKRKISLLNRIVVCILAAAALTAFALLSGCAEKSSSNADIPVYSYRQTNDRVQQYLDEAAYDPRDSSASVVVNYSFLPTDYDKSLPNGCTVELIDNGILTVTDNGSGGSYTENVGVGEYTFYNLTPGVGGEFVLRNDKGKIVQQGHLRPDGDVRMMNPYCSAYNIRDFGGWDADGGKLRYNMIFRGSELNGNLYGVRLTDEARNKLFPIMNIASEIDLRSDYETEGIDSSAFGSSVEYQRYAVDEYDLSDFTLYRATLQKVIDNAKAGKTTYVHCLAGADRTGTLAALIEGLCGVSESDIDKDYELTSFSDIRKRSNNKWQGMKAYINEYHGNTLSEKIISLCIESGISVEDINAFRSAMIDGTPAIISAPTTAESVSDSSAT